MKWAGHLASPSRFQRRLSRGGGAGSQRLASPSFPSSAAGGRRLPVAFEDTFRSTARYGVCRTPSGARSVVCRRVGTLVFEWISHHLCLPMIRRTSASGFSALLTSTIARHRRRYIPTYLTLHAYLIFNSSTVYHRREPSYRYSTSRHVVGTHPVRRWVWCADIYSGKLNTLSVPPIRSLPIRSSKE